MADSGPSRRHGWIPRVRVIPGNGLDSFGDLLGTDFRPALHEPLAEAGDWSDSGRPLGGLRSRPPPGNGRGLLKAFKRVLIGDDFLVTFW